MLATTGDLHDRLIALGLRAKCGRVLPGGRFTAIVGAENQHAGGAGRSIHEAIVEALSLYTRAFPGAVRAAEVTR